MRSLEEMVPLWSFILRLLFLLAVTAVVMEGMLVVCRSQAARQWTVI